MHKSKSVALSLTYLYIVISLSTILKLCKYKFFISTNVFYHFPYTATAFIFQKLMFFIATLHMLERVC